MFCTNNVFPHIITQDENSFFQKSPEFSRLLFIKPCHIHSAFNNSQQLTNSVLILFLLKQICKQLAYKSFLKRTLILPLSLSLLNLSWNYFIDVNFVVRFIKFDNTYMCPLKR